MLACRRLVYFFFLNKPFWNLFFFFETQWEACVMCLQILLYSVIILLVPLPQKSRLSVFVSRNWRPRPCPTKDFYLMTFSKSHDIEIMTLDFCPTKKISWHCASNVMTLISWHWGVDIVLKVNFWWPMVMKVAPPMQPTLTNHERF